MKKQKYILRYYLPQKPYFDENYTEKRFCELLEFCKRADVDAVMLYVALDPDWYYISDTPEYAWECREAMLPYIRRLREAGIGYHLNFQNLIGSTLGGLDLSKKFSWKNLVDQKGRESLGCGCPIDPDFRRQSGERLRIWAQTHPDVIWIDDDLRYHNHGTPVLAALDNEGSYSDYYCFCDAHIARFNYENGTSYDRDSLVRDMLKIGEPTKTRREYLEFLGKTMCETAEWIRQTVHAISPETKLAQMTSRPDVHSAEGRIWNDFLRSLCGEYTPIVRAHFGPYKEKEPRSFVDSFRYLAQTEVQILESLDGDKCLEICPEVENTRFTVWAKSASATRLQLELSAFMGNGAITLSLYDLDGGPFSDEPEYERVLVEAKSGLDKLVSLELGKCEPCGVIIPTSTDSAKNYRMRKGDSYESFGGKGRYIESYLLKMGVPCRYLLPKDICGGVVALDGYSAGFLSDDELFRILSCSVLLEAGAVEVLIERGFSHLLGVNGCERQRGYANVEGILAFCREDGTFIRIPSRIPSGCLYDIAHEEKTELLSYLTCPDGKRVAGLTYFENEMGGRIAIYPAKNDFGDGFFTHHRVVLFKDLLCRMSRELPRVDCSCYMMSASKRDSDGGCYYFLTNLSADTCYGFSINGKKLECSLNLYESTVIYESADKKKYEKII